MGGFKHLFRKKKTFTYKQVPDFKLITELSQISGIFDWVFNPDYDIAQTCAQTIHRVVTSPAILNNQTLYDNLGTIKLKKKDLARFYIFDSDIQQSLLCVASMNYDGYVREETLHLLTEFSNPKAFLFTLFRLADWVPSIRQIAQSNISQFIQNQDPDFLLKNREIIEWLLKVARVDLKVIYKEITEYIFSEKHIDEIIQNIDKYEAGERYYIYRKIISFRRLNTHILEKMWVDKNYLVRLLATQNTDLIKQEGILDKLLDDKSQKIRHYAINSIPITHLAQFQPKLEIAIFDNSAAIRTKARTLLSKTGQVNLPQRYREEVLKNPKPGSIIGLAEVGDKTDIEVVMKFLQSVFPKQRTAALLALAMLDYDLAKQQAFELLNDLSNGVKKACLKVVTKEKSAADLAKMRGLYDQANIDTKKFILKAINEYGGWSIVGDFLRAIKHSNVEIKNLAFAFLSKWHNYSIKLAAAQKETDKNYVLNIYKELDIEKLDLPQSIQKIVDDIPFIFREK